jgi:hypothetical protein
MKLKNKCAKRILDDCLRDSESGMSYPQWSRKWRGCKYRHRLAASIKFPNHLAAAYVGVKK